MIITYQDIMMEAELAAAYLRSNKNDPDNTPMNYEDFAGLYNLIEGINQESFERWRYRKEHGKE
jgi:hypothetical protein